MAEYPCMKDLDFKGRRVLVRTGWDVPVDDAGNILDTSRIIQSLDTIMYLLEHGAEKIIIIFHMGRPKAYDEKLSTKKVAHKLSELLKTDVIYTDRWNDLPEGRIIVLENPRFNPSEKSKVKEERDRFAQEIASNAEIFIMDAFSNMHHPDQASMSIMQYLPSCIGLFAEKELTAISTAMNNPKRPLVSIIGGLKAEKLAGVEAMLKRADMVLIAGALAFSVLYAYGHRMGNSKIDYEELPKYQSIILQLRNNPKVILPIDAVVADRFSADANSMIAAADAIPDGWMALDIGPRTIEMFTKAIQDSKTIIWNGPIGVFEFDKFSEGTKRIAEAIAGSDATSIIGGGDSAAAVKKLGYEDKVSFISTGGGASLMMFEGKTLPVLENVISAQMQR